MRVIFSHILCLTGLIMLGTSLSANGGVIELINEPEVYNVMILEADLKTPNQCDKAKWASNQAIEPSTYGFWFCKGSVLGRLVDEHFFANVQNADLVHFVLKPGARCAEMAGFERPPDRDVYIYLGNSDQRTRYSIFGQHANKKVNIIEEDDERATKSEFVQYAISVLEMEANSVCNPQAPSLNLTKWGWETLKGVDF